MLKMQQAIFIFVFVFTFALSFLKQLKTKSNEKRNDWIKHLSIHFPTKL